MQPIFQMKVSKQFPTYIPKIVERIFVVVGGPEASGSVLADSQPIGSDSGPFSIFRNDHALRPMRPPYSSSFCWICSVSGVLMVHIYQTRSLKTILKGALRVHPAVTRPHMTMPETRDYSIAIMLPPTTITQVA